MDKFQISEATPQDFKSIQMLMLNALQSDPTAFSSDYADYAQNSENWWQNYLYGYLTQTNAKLILAKQDGQLRGMIGLLFETKARRKHVASIVWFYVEPNSRKFGTGKELFRIAIENIKTLNYIKKIALLVNAPQQKALNIYKEFGFTIVGTLKEELLINNQFIDEFVMELYL